MHYIIDANNLAGKLGILFEPNFDKKLIELIKIFSQNKNIYYLIFDGIDFMGDKYSDNNLKIIYTPRDTYYASADDKIVEVIKDLIINHKVEVNLVTDDLEIIAKTDIISKDNKEKKFKLIKATDFAKKITAMADFCEDDDDEKKLNKKEMDKINQELLRLWS
ncbi:MAG: hypothetical protein US83_C0011G0042 [Candidatus Falkowbacteria bacterium GW2011_GWC2_38_22]|uniref:YacP-like NYN domain protein n=1 Tax=Candidatus Falkowbacteria bacterium GW2011_GWE1_38_31 TaxID=1618638 RepID=A0A0G0M826_9BACT|nr:MAG: hypothetical protein US73_C0009G0042 [Candidatus Falkowbacteria bacterium GW2011_GWF2_38_1205]KKQ60924.1 MAG: hypothetical protein US83_C0011G0042 [Candidatus Falkowbacteria bacterium GW2011_GWC2_38_22]KKQ63042.1 MAG: hypothetical protein US84_C0009G0042 [Candidatus Falkowbacteria bacterium GW2011_GWF1_38_22]KKQ65064.1 MAG: hypothetical protein US87_C0009G0042 [Candidatus Falkowbacteria bacterium GW2011_GWE2_38_254]KKQ69839.1 MAG: hypothetical protein US91_C0009G0042 [Candidatus Falkowb